ncbi:hypothetical protein [Qipengyuania flava]|uniref:hypothetical protein n=1 Tax=Qipengyuania flava TaxID=192812 RepID=UPI00273E56B6|nr:hypothetical protein [Qipengyuania flava]
MSRRWWVAGAAIGVIAISPPLSAQDAQSPPEQIDILAPQEDYLGPLEDCSAEQEAASISGEIVVCRRRRDNGEFAVDENGSQRRYAEETMNKGDPRTPDLFGIPDHGVVVARGCFIGPCPPPKALIIDIEALPEAPPGSDADRIARGLAPSGGETDGEATPPVSASPAEEPSG